MSDMNFVCITGRLTKAAELKYLQSGTCVCNFSIACNDSIKSKEDDNKWESRPDFFDCFIFGKYGESMHKHLSKGRLISITGRLKQDRWQKDGQTQSKISIKVAEIHLTPTGNKGTTETAVEEPVPESNTTGNESGEAEMSIF